MCRKYAGITEDLQVLLKMFRKNLQVLQQMYRESAGITANMQVFQKMCRISAGRCRKSEGITQYWKSYYAKNKVQINQRLRNQRRRKIGAWDQESEKLETSLVPSGTFCGTPTVET